MSLAPWAVESTPLEGLLEFFRRGPVIVLSGAGCSTESGIPDYRGPDRPHRSKGPIQLREFMEEPAARARYWSRSAVGWERFSAARPNPAHLALARMEATGMVRGVITQNVDGLHQDAGSREVLDLHGSLDRVRCMGCESVWNRDAVQARLRELNPDFATQTEVPAPDGDSELPDTAWIDFQVPACLLCGGVLKPDVVFFGEGVPRTRLEEAWRMFGRGDRLLVVGSSLTVFSGRRFVLRAADEGRPVAVVNLGPTRADDLAAVRVEGRLGNVLPRLAAELGA